jgi:carboxyl-terminal processing protease
MNKLLLLIVSLLFFHQLHSQIPDDTNGRLYRLCKTWGYFKYFSQNKCNIKWDTLLNTTINEVLQTTTNADYNDALMRMFNKVGNNIFISNPGVLPDTNINFNNDWINDPVFNIPVRNFLDSFSMYIYPDNSSCFIKYNDHTNLNYRSYIDFRNDLVTMPVDYKKEPNRLTVMFYYWNVINYFHPFRNIMDQSWDQSLYEFIPQMRNAINDTSFQITFLKLETKINDTHGFNGGPIIENVFWGGTYKPQIYFIRIDSFCVVKKVKNIPGVSPGDILTSLNGISIHEIEDSLRNYIPASTPASLYHDIYINMLKGTFNSPITFDFMDANLRKYSVIAKHTFTESGWDKWRKEKESTSSYFITQCNYGYVDMGKLLLDEVTPMMVEFYDLPSIIFDIRNYPNGTLWNLAPFLFPEPIESAIWYQPALTHLTLSKNYMPGWYYKANDLKNLGNWSNPDYYPGKIYLLVNEETISHAEYTCQYLSHHPNAKVIGTQTAGADGNVSYLNLPNGYYTYFTSLGWYYADGYQQQRNGVKIDSVVSPTIAGIRNGRDEILEAALTCLTDVHNSSSDNLQLNMFPNPVTNKLTIAFVEDKLHDLDICLFNILGEIVFSSKDQNIAYEKTIDLSSLANGIYFIELNIDGNRVAKKVVKY